MELLILIRMPSFLIMKSNFFLVFFIKYLKNYLAFSFSVLASYVIIYDPCCGHSYFVPLLLFSVLFQETVLISTCLVSIIYRISIGYQGNKAIKNTATPLISLSSSKKSIKEEKYKLSTLSSVCQHCLYYKIDFNIQ